MNKKRCYLHFKKKCVCVSACVCLLPVLASKFKFVLELQCRLAVHNGSVDNLTGFLPLGQRDLTLVDCQVTGIDCQ